MTGERHDDVRILQFGDSHTASDMGTAAFRRQMQTRFGDGGRGFVSIGRPWTTYVQEGVRGYMTPQFEPEKTRLKNAQSGGEGCYGLLGVDIAAEARGARAWTVLAPRFSRVELDYWQAARGAAASTCSSTGPTRDASRRARRSPVRGSSVTTSRTRRTRWRCAPSAMARSASSG